MSEINLEALHLTLKAVSDSLEDYHYAKENQSRLQMSVRDGAIQRFEVAMDWMQPLIMRILKEKYRLDEASAKRGWIREAAKLGMIADAKNWFGFLSARDKSSHTYDSVIANSVFEQIDEFLTHAHDLLKKLPSHVA